MRKLSLVFSVCFLAMLISCNDDDCPNCPPSGEIAPLFAVTVVDTSGDPVEGIEVGRINHWDLVVATNKAAAPNTSRQISFSLPEEMHVTCIVYNYNWDTVRVLADSQLFQAGTGTLEWDGKDGDGIDIIGGYYYEYLKAVPTDSTADEIEDTLAVAFETVDPDPVILGETDSLGRFSCDDTLVFPYLLGDPPLIEMRDELGRPTGMYLVYLEDVTISLSDPADSGNFRLIDTVLVKGANSFELVW